VRNRKIACLLSVWTAALAVSVVRAGDEVGDNWWNPVTIDPGFELALQFDVPRMLAEIASPVDGPWLLASSVTDKAPPNRVADPWWSMASGRTSREPTDPDSPSLPAGSSLESPWDAWENQAADSRGSWEFLDPEGR